MKKKLVAMIALAAVVACTSLPYKDDVGFLVSAQANSPEFPVYINGKICTDMEGFIGLCSKRIRSSDDVLIKFDPQPHAYLLTVNCTQGVSQIPPATVPSGQAYSFTIKSSDFQQMKSFTCIGEVSPQDSEAPVSAKFRSTFVVVDSEYSQREQIFPTKEGNKKFLVLGEYALNSWVYDQNEWKRYKKKTIVQIKGDPSKAKAYSESFAMRFNFWNMAGSQ